MSEFERDIERARAGDRSALQSLLTRNHGRMRRYTGSLLGQQMKARLSVSDVLQSCYVDIVRGISSFRESSGAAFEAWTRRVVENGVRRKSRQIGAQKRGAGRVGELPDELPSSTPTPSGQVVTAEQLARVDAALATLREDHREVLRLRLVEGLSHHDIARRMDRPLNATRMLLSRARAELSLRLERDAAGRG
ncbi:MAG: RNA polymerase sigma factor [Planctomycetota bacterium JB042]